MRGVETKRPFGGLENLTAGPRCWDASLVFIMLTPISISIALMCLAFVVAVVYVTAVDA